MRVEMVPAAQAAPAEDEYGRPGVLLRLKWRRDVLLPAPGWSVHVPDFPHPAIVLDAYRAAEPDYIVLLARPE